MVLAGVSRQTARRSVSDLVHEGVLRSEQGRGTFTMTPRVETYLHGPSGFTDTIRESGHEPSTKVLSYELVAASERVAQELHLDPGAWVARIDRLRQIDDRPAMLEQSHIVAALVPGLSIDDLAGSLYELLQTKYGIRPMGGSEVIIAVNADRVLARQLELQVGSAVLSTVRVTTDQSGRPFEFTMRHARADMCSFRVTLDGGSALTSRPLQFPLST